MGNAIVHSATRPPDHLHYGTSVLLGVAPQPWKRELPVHTRNVNNDSMKILGAVDAKGAKSIEYGGGSRRAQSVGKERDIQAMTAN
jgi:hypothetical protein